MKKGFTLIELLVVIAILAVLMSVIVVTLNPAEMLKKTRDTKRIADLDALRTAINLYVTDQGSLPSFSANCYVYTSGAPANGGCTPTVVPSQAINANGWIPIDFTKISSGAPLSSLPIDPKNSTTSAVTTTYVYYFAGKTASSTFELDANMESAYYSNGGAGDVESKDGGNNPDLYEVGSDLSLM
jgi:prepilin-type N-terminal cleavage/methylation domain-containing protein